MKKAIRNTPQVDCTTRSGYNMSRPCGFRSLMSRTVAILAILAWLLPDARGNEPTEREVEAAAAKAREFVKARHLGPAAEQYALAVDLSLRVHGLENGTTFGLMSRLAETYRLCKDYEKAEPLYEAVLKILEQRMPGNPVLAEVLGKYGEMLRTQNRQAEADAVLTLIKTIEEKKNPTPLPRPQGLWESIRGAGADRGVLTSWTKQGDQVANNQCVFEVQAEEGATVLSGKRVIGGPGKYGCSIPPAGLVEVLVTVRHPDGSDEVRRLIARDGRCVRVPAFQAARDRYEVVLQAGHASTVYSVGFRPGDGERVLTASSDGTVAIWETSSGQKIRTLPGRRENFAYAAFSPDGQRVATTTDQNSVILWDAETGQRLVAFVGHTEEVLCLAFCPKCNRLVTGSGDQTARIWDTATGKSIHILRGHTGTVSSVAFDSTGSCVLTGSHDNTAALWDSATGTRQRVFGKSHKRLVTSIAFGPDSKHFAVGSVGGVTVWAVDGNEPLWTRDTLITPFSLAFSPDGKELLTGGLTEVQLWDSATGNPLAPPQKPEKDQFGVAFSPDGRRFLTGGADHAAVLWDRATGEKVQEFRGHADAVNSLAFSPDGRQLLTANGSFLSASGSVLLWDLVNSLGPRSFEGSLYYSDLALFTPDGHGILACYSFANEAVLWRTESLEGKPNGGGQKFSHPRRPGQPFSAAFSTDGRLLALGHSDVDDHHELIVWDVATAKPGPPLTGHTDRITALAFAPDGTIYSGSLDGTVRSWNPAAQRCVRILKQGEPVAAVALSPTGDRLVTAGRLAALWNTATGKLVRVFAGHSGRIRGCA